MILASPSNFLPVLSGANANSLSHSLDDLFRIYAAGPCQPEGSQTDDCESLRALMVCDFTTLLRQ